MKTRKQLIRKLGAWLMAIVFLLQTAAGFFPVTRVRAAAAGVEEWDENDLMDYQYRFNFRYQKGITKAEPFGCDNQDYESFTNHGRIRDYVVTHRVTPNYRSGSAGVRYYNVGKDENGNIVDFRVTLLGVTNAEERYDIFTPYTKYYTWKEGKEDIGEGYDWKNGMGKPMIAFGLNNISVFIYCMEAADIQFEFLKHNTEEALTVSGHGTIRDLDAGQGVRFPQNNNLDHIYLLKRNPFLKANGLNITAPLESLESDDKRGWLNFLYSTHQIRFGFANTDKIAQWDEQREKGIESAGSAEKWAASLRKLYSDPDGNTYAPDFKGQKIVRGHAYFDFTAFGIGEFRMEKEPEKRVGAVGSSWENALLTTRENSFPITEYEEFQYMIQAELVPNHFSSFIIQDTLKECLTIDGTSKVVIRDDNGDEVTGQFDVRIEGQTITCEAKQKYLKQEEFVNNRTYTFILRVHRKEGASVADFLLEDGYTFLIPNSAVMTYSRQNGKGETKTTPEVWVKGKIIPNLEVEKAASRYEWAVGDHVEYTVKVTQKKPNAWAMNTVVEDISIPSCLQLIDGEYAVESSPGVEHCVMEKIGENGWRVHCPLLQYDESIQITFRCLAREEANGNEWINTVTVRAENFTDPVTGEERIIKDLAEVWINTPDLEINKTADKYEWRVGDEVQYRIVVNNRIPGTVVRDINITDIGIPEGLVLSGGVSSVEVLGVPQSVDFPISDHKTGQMMDERIVESRLQGDERGFSLYCSYLPYSMPVTILFHCTAVETANGRESVNVASVQAGNAAEKLDDAECYVNTGSFWIDKTADHYEWQLGEQVQYQVVVENQYPGTVARNVTIWDTDMPAGLALQSPDSVSVTGIPESIENPAAGTPDVPSQLNPEAYQQSEQKQVSYEFAPEGTGWRLNISDLPAQTPVTITFFCTVTDEVNGMESINMASVQAENAPVQSDDAEIYVNTAMLSIKKDIHNPYLQAGDGRAENEFRVGETVEYQVDVTNLQKGSIARDLVITDTDLPQGLCLDGAEDALTVYGIPQTIMNPVAGTDDYGNQINPENYNETVEKQVEYQLNREGTGWTLYVSDLPYQMTVSIVFRCTVQEELNGWEVINTAHGAAANAEEVKASAKIWVNSPVLKIEKKADKPSYKYGDIATYRIVVTQEQPGCVARNVTVSDIIDTPGVRLLKDSMILLDQEGNLVDCGVEANDDNSFILHTGHPLIKETPYWIYDGEQGGALEQVIFNPLEEKAEKSMIVEYQAAIIDEGLAGQTVHNLAVVNSPENYPAEDEELVEIHSPILDIVKESDKKEYHVGETGYYKLTIRQLREDVKAENITIEDTISHPGAVIQTDSILIRKNGTVMKDVAMEADAGGFRIMVQTELTDADKLEVLYKVVFESPDLDQMAVINTAKAKGDNTPEIWTDNEVYIDDLRPSLSVIKTSDKKKYGPGETAHYEVRVTQTEKGAAARRIVLRDILKDDQAVIVKGSVELYDAKGVKLDKPEIEETPSGYTIHTGMDLEYKETLTVKYDVFVPEEITEKEIVNIAMATSENMKPGDEKIPDPAVTGDGLRALKTSDPVSGSVVEEGQTITYFITVSNVSDEIKKNIMVKDAIPEHTVFEKFGDTGGELLNIEGTDYAAFLVEELAPDQSVTVSFQVKREKMEREDSIVNLAQVRETLANKKDITIETWKSARFYNTNSTIHYGDTRWVREEHQITVKPEVTPTPKETPAPSKAPEATPTLHPTAPEPSVTPYPTKTPSVTVSPRPTTGTCPKNTPIPNGNLGSGSTGNGFGSGSGNPGNGSGGNYYGNGSYGGSLASGSKTGDSRPFAAVARVGLLGILLLAGGAWTYRRSKKGERHEE